jgi:hypothetical protein
MSLLKDVRTIASVALLAIALMLLVFQALPALSNFKSAKAELRYLNFEIDRLRNFAEREGAQARMPSAGHIPETPDVASMMGATRRSQEEIGVRGLVFETMHTESRFLPEITDEYGNPYQYLHSAIRVSFESDTRNAARFLDSIVESGPGGNVENVTLTRRHSEEDPVNICVLISLHGIPR